MPKASAPRQAPPGPSKQEALPEPTPSWMNTADRSPRSRPIAMPRAGWALERARLPPTTVKAPRLASAKNPRRGRASTPSCGSTPSAAAAPAARAAAIGSVRSSPVRLISLAVRLEHVWVRHLHGTPAVRRREGPAPHVAYDAALDRLARQRGLLHQRIGHAARAVDDEEHGHLAMQRRVAGQLLFVAVLDLVVMPLNDSIDHLARQAPHHHGPAGNELRLLLAAPSQIDVAVAAAPAAA